MRFSHAVVIALALQIKGCEAGLFDWVANLWNDHVKPFFVSTAEKVANFVTNAWNSVKRAATTVYNWVKNAIMAVIGKVREWGETDWDCGADNFWPSKVAAKIQAEIACKRIYEKINDACKRHDRCYSKKAQTQLECDKVFCEELDNARYTYESFNVCLAPETFCAAVLYAGHIAY